MRVDVGVQSGFKVRHRVHRRRTRVIEGPVSSDVTGDRPCLLQFCLLEELDGRKMRLPELLDRDLLLLRFVRCITLSLALFLLLLRVLIVTDGRVNTMQYHIVRIAV